MSHNPTDPADADGLLGSAAAPTGETVTELGPHSSGRWLVRSRDSEHVFDLDAGTYSRRPGRGVRQFRHDGHTVPLTTVERWPAVGGRFHIVVDDPEFGEVIEHWHISSRIRSIEALPPVENE